MNALDDCMLMNKEGQFIHHVDGKYVLRPGPINGAVFGYQMAIQFIKDQKKFDLDILSVEQMKKDVQAGVNRLTSKTGAPFLDPDLK